MYFKSNKQRWLEFAYGWFAGRHMVDWERSFEGFLRCKAQYKESVD